MKRIVKNLVTILLSVITLLIIFIAPSAIYADISKIVFASYVGEGNSEIYIMNADGSGQTRLTNNTSDDKEPSFSANGTKIAFVSNRDGNEEIYIMNSDGSGQTRLTNNNANDNLPSLSHDGSKIAFCSNRSGSWEIYIMNADGTNVVRLTNDSYTDYAPSFSPDGSKIAFVSSRSGGFYEIYIMNVNGTNVVRLTNNSYIENYPSLSPDGSKIAFCSNRYDSNFELFIMNADGSGQTRLTNNSGFDGNPSFSPDGSKIAFTSYRTSNRDIYLMNADGSGLERITTNTAPDDDPSFSFPVYVPPAPDAASSAINFNEKSLSEYGKTPQDFIIFLYNRILEREPDEAGYDEWVIAADKYSLSSAELVMRFISSTECQEDISGYSNEQFVIFLYKSLFNRAPDNQGFDGWILNMNEGMTREDVIKNFCSSPEFKEISIYFDFGDV